MSYAKSFVVYCWSLWYPVHGYICRSVITLSQPISFSMFSPCQSEVEFQTFSSAPHYSHGNSINKSIDQSFIQSINQSIDQSIN